MITLKQRVQANKEEVAAKVMDGEAILINLSNGIYYSMDKVGAALWELIEKNCSPEEMVTSIISRYEVQADQAQADVKRLLNELIEEKLISETDNGAKGHTEDPPKVKTKEPYDPPQLNIYRDMGDLLALDPPTPGLEATPWKDPSEENKD